MKNTYKQGKLAFICYPTQDGTNVVACAELCLVIEGKDCEEIKYRILAAAKRYLKNVIQHKLGENLLNQSLPKEIKEEFNKYRLKKENEHFEKWNTSIKELLKIKSNTDLKKLILV